MRAFLKTYSGHYFEVKKFCGSLNLRVKGIINVYYRLICIALHNIIAVQEGLRHFRTFTGIIGLQRK